MAWVGFDKREGVDSTLQDDPCFRYTFDACFYFPASSSLFVPPVAVPVFALKRFLPTAYDYYDYFCRAKKWPQF